MCQCSERVRDGGMADLGQVVRCIGAPQGGKKTSRLSSVPYVGEFGTLSR